MKIYNHEKTNSFSIIFEESDEHLIDKKFYVEGTYDHTNWYSIPWGMPDPDCEGNVVIDYEIYELTEVPMLIDLCHTAFLEVRIRWE